MSDFSDWVQDEMPLRTSIDTIEAAGSLLVKVDNIFSRDYETIAQGSSDQILTSNGAGAAPEFKDLPSGFIFTAINGEAFTINICEPVYISNNDTVKLAKADALGTSEVLGLIDYGNFGTGINASIRMAGVLETTTGNWDTVTGDSGGLTVGDIYFLDPDTAGRLTTTAPTTTGDLVVRIGEALSTTKLRIEIQQPILR